MYGSTVKLSDFKALPVSVLEVETGELFMVDRFCLFTVQTQLQFERSILFTLYASTNAGDVFQSVCCKCAEYHCYG